MPSGEVRQNEEKEEVEGNYMIKKKKFITLHLSKQTLCKNDCLEQCINYLKLEMRIVMRVLNKKFCDIVFAW